MESHDADTRISADTKVRSVRGRDDVVTDYVLCCIPQTLPVLHVCLILSARRTQDLF